VPPAVQGIHPHTWELKGKEKSTIIRQNVIE